MATGDPTMPPQPVPSGTAPVTPSPARPETDPTQLPTIQTVALSPSRSPGPTQMADTEQLGSPVMKRGKIAVNGVGLDAPTVTRYLNKQTANFLMCYQRAASLNPHIAGATTLTFKIAGDGKVSDADTSGGVDRDVEQCLAGVATGIEFPRSHAAGVTVSYPLTFEWH